MLTVVKDGAEVSAAGGGVLDEIVGEGARAMLAAALRAEVAAYVEAYADEVGANGRRLLAPARVSSSRFSAVIGSETWRDPPRST